MSVRRHPGGAEAEPARPAGLRIAVVTETYPPEINGVAGTVARLVEGFLGEGHRVELIRPLQPGVDTGVGSRGSARRAPSSPGRNTSGAIPDLSERLTRGMSIPGYAGLRMGLPAPRMLRRAWRSRRPDLVHIATEGPLGWSALRVARGLGIPVVSEFRTNFHAYSGHYGVGLLRPWVLDYLRWFHNRCALTMVPTTPGWRARSLRFRASAGGRPGRRCTSLQPPPSLRGSEGVLGSRARRVGGDLRGSARTREEPGTARPDRSSDEVDPARDAPGGRWRRPGKILARGQDPRSDLRGTPHGR